MSPILREQTGRTVMVSMVITLTDRPYRHDDRQAAVASCKSSMMMTGRQTDTAAVAGQIDGETQIIEAGSYSGAEEKQRDFSLLLDLVK